jgi:uncharacterized protein (DUF1330 family)
MTAFVVFLRERTTDPVELKLYGETVVKSRENHALTSMTPRGGEFEVLEGGPAEGMVILQFPTAPEARAWYTSAAYKEASLHRLKGCVSRVFIVEGA